MTISEARLVAIKKLSDSGIDTPHLDADVLLGYILKKPREYLYSHSEKIITQAQYKKFQGAIKRRSRFEPIAYLVEHKEFYGLDFYVNKNVLVPRPETELLIEKVIDYVQANTLQNIAIADIGTGSGCIAITLKKNLPEATITATDISTKSLIIAKRNAKTHQINIKFKKGNLLTPINHEPIDIIIANLPYVPSTDKQKKTVFNRALRFEPSVALYSGPDGLNKYRKLFAQVKTMRHTPRAIFIEFDPRQYKKIQAIAAKELPGSTQIGYTDLADQFRALLIEKV